MPTMTLPTGSPYQNYSDLLGLKQQQIGIQQAQQTLQTGRALQQSAQAQAITADAEAKQQQQKLLEMQFAKTTVPLLLKDPRAYKSDGVLDADFISSHLAPGMPTTFPEVSKGIYATQEAGYKVKDAALKLNVDRRQAIGSAITGAANSPDFQLTKPSDLSDFITGLEKQFPDGKDVIHALVAGANIPTTEQDGSPLKAYTPDMAKEAKTHLGIIANALLTPAEQEGAGGKFTKQVTPYQAPGGMGYMQTNPNAPGGVAPTGPVVSQGLAPQVVSSPVPGTPPAVLSNGGLHPLGGGMGGGPVRGGPPAVGPKADPLAQFHMAPGEADVVTGAAKSVGARAQQAIEYANRTPQAQDALYRALDELDAPNPVTTGGFFESRQALAQSLSGIGIDTKQIDSRATLVKNLARYEAQRATAAGLGGTDAARDLSHNGNPNTNIPNGALRGIVLQSLATEKALAMLGNVQQNNQNDPKALAANETSFRKIPHLIQVLEYQMMRNPKEAEQYLKTSGLSSKELKESAALIKDFSSR